MPSPLLAFGFESLPMLGWLAAAAAPWLIHLLTRRKHRETPWAAMDFLIAAVKRQSRRIRLEQLLLLLLRTLVIVAVVMAVAEPYVEHAGAVFSSGGSTHRVLVIDSSYSMAYKPGDRSRFDQAKLWAAQIVEHSTPGDGFTLLQMADPPRAVVSTPALEAGPVRQEIENLELLHTGADVPATLTEVRKLLDAARRDSPRLTRAEVYIFTDMQRGSWMPGGDAAKAVLRSRGAELAAVARLHVIDLGQPDDDNLAVTSLEARAPYVLADRGVTFTATLRDFGHSGRKLQAVDLLVDHKTAGRKYVDVPAGGEATVQFLHRFATSGEHAVEVGAPGDNLEIDNRRYLVVDVREAIRVLCIDGRPAGDPAKASIFELSHALLSQSDPGERPPIKIQVAPESAVAERDLSEFDCVAFSNVAQFTSGEARLLDNYLGRGGSLVFFLGDRVRAENYNRVLADGPCPILPSRLIGVAKNTAGTLDPLGYRHPILEKFRGHQEVDLPHWFVERYFKVKPLNTGPGGDANQAASDLSKNPPQIALGVGNGDPLIVARPVRHGRVVLVTTSADYSWQLLENFEPLVKGILDWCLAGQGKPRNVLVGDALESSFDKAVGAGTIASALPSAAVSIERPDGRRATAPVIHGDDRAWSYDDTRISGIYSAQLDSEVQLFAVNLKTAESDLTRLSRDELQEQVLPGVALDYQTAWQAGAARLALPEGSAGQLHVVLLYAAAGLLLLETVLAWRMGINRR